MADNTKYTSIHWQRAEQIMASDELAPMWQLIEAEEKQLKENNDTCLRNPHGENMAKIMANVAEMSRIEWFRNITTQLNKKHRG